MHREFRTPNPSLFKRVNFISSHKIQERCAKGCLNFHGKPTDFRALRGFNRSLSKSPVDVQANTLTKMNWILSSQRVCMPDLISTLRSSVILNPGI